MELEGASTIYVSESILYLDAELSGSSDLLDYGLDISNLDINLAGASTLHYKGNATIQASELTGSSQIIKKN